jgi:hypothetical protein
MEKILLAAMVLAVGCGRPPVDADSDEPTLANRDTLLHGSVSNDQLPPEGKPDQPLPRKYTDLVALQSDVKKQGLRGLCTLFASIGLMEYQYKKAGMPATFSEQFLQWELKTQLNGVHIMPSGLLDVLGALEKVGTVHDDQWRYEEFPWNTTDDPACDRNEITEPVRCLTNGDPPAAALSAPLFRFPGGRQLEIGSVRNHMLSSQAPVIVAVDYFKQAWNDKFSPYRDSDAWDLGFINYPNPEDIATNPNREGHAILLVGWDEDLSLPRVDAKGQPMLDEQGQPVVEKGFYIFKNSWGTIDFGFKNPYGAGYGYIPLRYVTDFGAAYVAGVAPPPAS